MRIKNISILSIIIAIVFMLSALYRVYADVDVLAMVTGVYGTLKVDHKGQVHSAKMREHLFKGDTLKTDSSSKATILLQDRSEIKMAPNTTIVIQPKAEKKGILVTIGKIFATITKQKSNFDISSPHGAAAIEGTELQLEVEKGKTSVVVADGRVRFGNSRNSVSLNQSFEGTSTSNSMAIGSPKKVQYQNLIRWQSDLNTYIKVIDNFMNAFNQALQIKVSSGTGSLYQAQQQMNVIIDCQRKLDSMVPDPLFDNGHRYLKSAIANYKTYLVLNPPDPKFLTAAEADYQKAQYEFTNYQNSYNQEVQKYMP